MKPGAKLFTMESFEKWQQTAKNLEEQLVPIVQNKQFVSHTLPTYRNMQKKPAHARISAAPKLPVIKTEPRLVPVSGIKTEHLDGEFWPTVPVGQSKTEIKDLLQKGLDFNLETLDMQDRLKRLHINEKMPPPSCGCVKLGESKTVSAT